MPVLTTIIHTHEPVRANAPPPGCVTKRANAPGGVDTRCWAVLREVVGSEEMTGRLRSTRLVESKRTSQPKSWTRARRAQLDHTQLQAGWRMPQVT
jgi:hypothetical protein